MTLRRFYMEITASAVFMGTVFVQAQGYGSPLTMNGTENGFRPSAASRSSGGLMFGIINDPAMMFAHPAGMMSGVNPHVSFGTAIRSRTSEQVQQYAPLKYYSSFSLFMEGLTRDLPNPVYDTTRTNYTAADTIQRPFDAISPNWTKESSYNIPVQLFASLPVTVGDLKFAAGIGSAEYAGLDWFFQNNNVLSPSILTPDPFVPTRPINDADSNSRPIQWYQSTQQRTGFIRGTGGAVAATLFENFHIGAGVLILSGTSDDIESRVERGRIRLYANYFRAESVYYRISQRGTSEYSGMELSFSSYYTGRNITAGIAVRFPTTVSRSFTGTIFTDTTGMTVSRTVSGTDEITLPFRTTAGLSLQLTQRLRFGVEYELNPFASAEYNAQDGSVTYPWISSNIARLGISFDVMEGITLRTGVREHAEVFEPFGNPLDDEPVGYSVYTAGAGFVFSGVRLNVSYEYATMKFVDMWAGAVSINTRTLHTTGVDLSYEIPW